MKKAGGHGTWCVPSHIFIHARIATVVAVFLFAVPFAAARQSTPSPELLQHEIASRIERVDEFRYIRKRAAELGLRVWLFGGTAASFAHYVAWDLRREQGSAHFPQERFDYASASIYRLGQDLDLVYDGPLAAAETLEADLRERYRHFQGGKSAWELRPLSQARGNKGPVLGSDDFSKQSTDSQSVGLVEVTLSASPTVRDALAWEAPVAPFLVDVAAGRIRYLYSDAHGTTARARLGLNPEILSAVRFLIKQQQFGLVADDADWARVRAVCDAFDEMKVTEPYVRRWLERNVPKVIRFSVNVEDAFRVLDSMGVREKFARLGEPHIGTMPWWITRKPLPSRPVGEGEGDTAVSLEIDVVAHETSSLEVLEGIVRHPGDEPVVLISRENTAGENAKYGEGFYTRRGTVGGRGTGYTVRFALLPNAREFTDFVRAGDDFVRVLNRKALRVLPDALDARPEAFINLLAIAGPEHRGLVERVSERVFRKLPEIGETGELQLAQAAAQAIVNYRGDNDDHLLNPWFASPASVRHPELLKELFYAATQENRFDVGYALQPRRPLDTFARAVSHAHWAARPETAELLDSFIRQGFHPAAIRGALTADVWMQHPYYERWIRWLLNSEGNEKRIIEHILPLPQATSNPTLLPLYWKFFQKSELRGPMYLYVMRKAHWANETGAEWLRRAINWGDGKLVLGFVLPTEHWVDKPEAVALVEHILQTGKDPSALVGFLSAQMPTFERAFAFRWIPALLADDVPAWRRWAAWGLHVSDYYVQRMRQDLDKPGDLRLHDYAFADYLSRRPQWLEEPMGRRWWVRLHDRKVASKTRLLQMVTEASRVAAQNARTAEANDFLNRVTAKTVNRCGDALEAS